MYFLENTTIKIFRYQANYTHKNSGEAVTEKFATEEKAQKRIDQHGNGTITSLDVSNYEWLDGIELPNDGSAAKIAKEIFEAGEEAWNAKKQERASKTQDQLRADIDFIAAMQGVSL